MYEDVLELLTQVLERHSARVLPGCTPLEALVANHHQRRHGRKGWRRMATVELHPTDGRAQAE